MDWTDDPLPSADADTLSRSAYAASAAGLIVATHSFESSVVFGLSGPWGSGKTSLINMIVEKLRAQHGKWRIAAFTPWATSDATGLLAEFYSALADALPKKRADRARKALAATAQVVAPAAHLVPVAGGSVEAAVRVGAEQLARAKPWQKAFEDASRRLRELSTPILVVVDDIDRLHRDELMILLKVIRLLGRFPGVQYLLAYDDETLYRNLDVDLGVTVRDGSAERFLEKIVQYPLVVPPMLQQQQLARLDAGFNSIRPGVPGVRLDRIGALLPCFMSMLRTPRAIDRYTAQVRHHTPMWAANEIDDEDVALLTLIRVTCPALFNQLPIHKNELLTGHTREFKRPMRNGLEYQEFSDQTLLDLAPPLIRGEAALVLHSLFPKLRDEISLLAHPSITGRGIGTEPYFDRYFAMNIPLHDVSNAEVDAAAKAARNGDASLLKALLTTPARERRVLVVSKLVEATPASLSDNQHLTFARSLVDVANQLDDFSERLSAHDQVLGLIATQLANLEPTTPVDDVMPILEALSENQHRVRLCEMIDRSRQARPLPGPRWIDELNSRIAQEGVDSFISNLRQGDTAPTNDGASYQLHFAISFGDLADLQQRVRELLDSKIITLEVLASRMITARSPVGEENWELAYVDQATFDALAPHEDDPWYHEDQVEVDVCDTSWKNKRHFARGRFTQPSEEPAESKADV